MNIDKITVYGFEEAIRGMRNPMDSWGRIDSKQTEDGIVLGPNDLGLMQRLIKAGPEHCKFLRYITVYVDIEAPLYWWKEFDTYKFKESNSRSTMHRITHYPLTPDCFQWEKMTNYRLATLKHLNGLIDLYKNYGENIKNATEPEKKEEYSKLQKDVFREIIQDLPSSYLQKRTIVTNYAELRNMYFQRKAHKLSEWREDFIAFVDKVPYAKELITLTKEQ